MNLNKLRTKFTVFVGILLFVLFMQVWPKSSWGFFASSRLVSSTVFLTAA